MGRIRLGPTSPWAKWQTTLRAKTSFCQNFRSPITRYLCGARTCTCTHTHNNTRNETKGNIKRGYKINHFQMIQVSLLGLFPRECPIFTVEIQTIGFYFVSFGYYSYHVTSQARWRLKRISRFSFLKLWKINANIRTSPTVLCNDAIR